MTAAFRRLAAAPALAALAALAGLAACATDQKLVPAAPTTSVAAPPPPVVTMAPIANPEAPPRREPATPRSRSEGSGPHRAAPARTAPAGGPAPAPPPPGAGVDPAAAARLRARGLEELNRGAVAKAVGLLSQASRLDPGSSVIRRDLERAERINRAVHP